MLPVPKNMKNMKGLTVVMYICLSACMYVRMYMCIPYVYMHIYIYIYLYRYVYIHVRTLNSPTVSVIPELEDRMSSSETQNGQLVQDC